jgi:hypothetical protein
MNDYINGCIELVGAYFTWRNALQLHRDQVLKGVYWPTTAFFTLWGLWNCWFYPNLHLWWSFVAGVILVLGNVAWVILALTLLRKHAVTQSE